MNRVHWRPSAVADLDDIAEHIATANLDAAIRFCHAVESDVGRLAAFPGIGTRREFSVSALSTLRSWPVKGYRNYLIFYLPTSKGIEIVRIVHGARNLGELFS